MRLAKNKRTFNKGYLPNWTAELFTVVRCIETRLSVYLFKDDNEEKLEGLFYAEELQEVIKKDDVYKIDKNLEKKNERKKIPVSCQVVGLSGVLQQLDRS